MEPPFRRLVPLLQRIRADLEQLWGCFRAAFGPLWNALRACLGTVLGLLLDGLRVTLQCIRACLGTGLELLSGGFRATLQCMRPALNSRSLPSNTFPQDSRPFSGDRRRATLERTSGPGTELRKCRELEMDDVRRAYCHTRPRFLYKKQRIHKRYSFQKPIDFHAHLHALLDPCITLKPMQPTLSARLQTLSAFFKNPRGLQNQRES